MKHALTMLAALCALSSGTFGETVIRVSPDGPLSTPQAARDEVRRRAEADVAKLQGELEKARAVAARAEQSERARRRAEDPLADVGSLKDLLDLTDKAPRRAE